ncbi:hypothetical protein MBLNU457_3716t1 [Dothideomycetes sp. NU457]
MRTRSKGDSKGNFFPLLDLPAELRNHVYELVVSGDCIYVTHRGDEVIRRPAIGDQHARAITRVCRQTRHESLEIYFQSNTFVFECPLDIQFIYSQWEWTLQNLRPWLEGRFPCLHYRDDVNELFVSPNLDVSLTDMGTLLDQLWIIFDFAFRGLNHLVSLEVLARPIRRAALATQHPPTSSLLNICITEAFRLGVFARDNSLSESDRTHLFEGCCVYVGADDQEDYGSIPEFCDEPLRFIPA